MFSINRHGAKKSKAKRPMNQEKYKNSVLWPRCCTCEHFHQFVNAYERHLDVVGEVFNFCLKDRKNPVLLDKDITEPNECMNFSLNKIKPMVFGKPK